MEPKILESWLHSSVSQSNGNGAPPDVWSDYERLRARADSTCEWKLDDPYYESACGKVWQFIDGDLSENGVSYCPFCGGKIVTELSVDDSSDRLALPCDHEWEIVDHSFDHEYGCEQILVDVCVKCGEERPHNTQRMDDDVI